MFTPHDAQTAKHHLQLALESAEAEGSSVTEWEIAEHHFKLGRVLFAMGDGPQKEVSALSTMQGPPPIAELACLLHFHGASWTPAGPCSTICSADSPRCCSCIHGFTRAFASAGAGAV